jgi:membrane protease YdiL (CAAX protease family)
MSGMTDPLRVLRRVPPSVAFLAVAAVVLVSSAVLAPLIARVLPYPFPRVLTRVLMIEAILAVAVFVRFRREMFVRFGLAWLPGSGRQLGTGFVAGLAGLILFGLVSVTVGNAVPAPRLVGWAGWGDRIAGGLVTSILVGGLEEFFFRGFVFTWFRDRHCRGRALPAAIAASVAYAVVHFLHPQESTISATPGVADSVRLILAPLQSLADWAPRWPAGVGLLLFGLVLNYCRIRTGALYQSIGLHAGCVAFLRVSDLFLEFGPTGGVLWSTKLVYDGAVCWLFLLLIGLSLTARAGKAKPVP